MRSFISVVVPEDDPNDALIVSTLCYTGGIGAIGLFGRGGIKRARSRK